MARSITPILLPSSPEINTLADLGAFIRSRRTHQGLRIDDAASLCKVSVQLFSDLENGSRAVGLDKALGVAQKFGLTLLAVTPEQLPFALQALRRSESP